MMLGHLEMRHSRHGLRRLLAALACLVWVLGFELVPNLHVGMHEAFGHHHHGVAGVHVVAERGDDHDHDHDHDHVHVHDHVHDHGAAEDHQHAEDHEHGAAEPEAIALAVVEPPVEAAVACESITEHGRHSLAHRGIAATPAPWGLAPVASAPWTTISRVCTPAAEPRSRRPQTTRARGPPALT
jgi:hypothetical protein